MGKTHAKDYLIEFASNTNKDWLKCLIVEAINTNGNISEERLSDIYLNLSNGKVLTIPEIQIRGGQRDSIQLLSLKHISGINALASNQTIIFSPNVTILHGMNGAGKSSYFRVLNEITGGNQEKTILPNIYIDTPDPISVEIKYKKLSSSSENFINWDGQNRALQDLCNCRVFDSSYLNGFLQPRSIDEALILPLGLKLFAYIASIIDKFKSQLNSDSADITRQKPKIDFSKFSEETKTALLNNNVQNEVRAKIENYYQFNKEDNERLESIQHQLKELKQINIADKIALLNKNKQIYLAFKEQLNSICHTFSDLIPEVIAVTKTYMEKKEKSAANQKLFAIFNSIPDSDSHEWKLFIQAAHKYHPTADETICPYCRQPLQTQEARALLKAYYLFMNDKTEDELQEAERNLLLKLKKVESTNTYINLSPEIELLIENKTVDKISLKQYVQQGYSIINDIKKLLIQVLQNKTLETIDSQVPDFSELIVCIDEECRKIDMDLEVLSQSPEAKSKTIELLEKQKLILDEKRAIANQHDMFIAWFRLDETEKKLQNLASEMSTADITRLANSANDELLTEKLKISFAEELKELGKQGLQVELIKAGSTKGKQNTRLILKGNKSVTDILSEGEQKAIGLALFLAEIRSSETNNPIILDDPVNSLDHQIAGAFAERLIKLNNQVILFNHNLLFLDAFECSRSNHICKSGDSACCNARGKHIKIYKVCDEGLNSKGVIADYKQNKADNHIRDAERLLNQSPFEEQLKVSALIRKAVECTIDEVIFRGQCPTKYSTKNSRIDWNALVSIGADKTIIEKLHTIHDRVSGGEMHNGSEAIENPIRKDELSQFVIDLKNILSI